MVSAREREFRFAERAARRDLTALAKYGITAERRALQLDRAAAAVEWMRLNAAHGDAARAAGALVRAVRAISRCERGATTLRNTEPPEVAGMLGLPSASARERTRRVSVFLSSVLVRIPVRHAEVEGLVHEVAIAYGRLARRG